MLFVFVWTALTQVKFLSFGYICVLYTITYLQHFFPSRIQFVEQKFLWHSLICTVRTYTSTWYSESNRGFIPMTAVAYFINVNRGSCWFDSFIYINIYRINFKLSFVIYPLEGLIMSKAQINLHIVPIRIWSDTLSPECDPGHFWLRLRQMCPF